ncbi:6-carboxytetrahydropterin synthase [Rheinheimera sp.]|uniref:6-carboxytetrahydropterin synthase n=1 Tax=Rheinheimera sp. TaxID=1869214 RepID=UPI00307F57D3
MILFVRDLTVIDFSYLCQQRGLLGESYIVDVELHGDLDQMSMVLDFARVKKNIKKAIDELVDHKLAIPALSAATDLIQADRSVVKFQSAKGLIQVASPADAFVAIPAAQISMDSISSYLTEHIKALLPANVLKLVLSLRTEQISGFSYHYTHGLKKHDGNCQRIAHGHRSTIQIYQDQMLSPRLNKYWCERWEDIYLGSTEDQCDAGALRYLDAEPDALNFCYDAPQGYFEISLPAAVCEVVPCDTTVECLADFIASELKQQQPDHQFKVVAYEGVGKGAIGFA